MGADDMNLIFMLYLLLKWVKGDATPYLYLNLSFVRIELTLPFWKVLVLLDLILIYSFITRSMV